MKSLSPIIPPAARDDFERQLRAGKPDLGPLIFMDHAGEQVVCRIPNRAEARAYVQARATHAGAVALFNAIVLHPAGEELRKLMRAKPALAITFGVAAAQKCQDTALYSPAVAGAELDARIAQVRRTADEELIVLEVLGEQAICRPPSEGEVLHFASGDENAAVRAEPIFEQCVLFPAKDVVQRWAARKPFLLMAFGIDLLRQAGLALEAENFELRGS